MLTLATHWLTAPPTGSTDGRRDLLVVGPSLGTGVVALWAGCARELAAQLDVDILGWDLPGHGDGGPTDQPFTLQELAEAVVAAVGSAVEDVAVEDSSVGDGAVEDSSVKDGSVKDGAPGRTVAPWVHAGVSVGGATGLHLALAGQVRASAVLCSGPKLGTPESWTERAATVRGQGTAVMVDGSRERWFGPGFVDREPATADRLLATLAAADAESYAQVCGALAQHDVQADLASIDLPVLLLGGADDVVAPPQLQEATGAGIPGSTVVVLDGVAHLAPAEDPVGTARAIAAWWPQP